MHIYPLKQKEDYQFIKYIPITSFHIFAVFFEMEYQ